MSSSEVREADGAGRVDEAPPTGEVAAALDVHGRGGESPRPPVWSFARLDGEPALAHRLRCADNVIGMVEAGLLAVFLLVLIGVGAVQAIAGNLAQTTFSGSNEVIRSMVFFIAMTGAALAAQRRRLISMDVVSRLLPARARAVVRIVIALFTVGMLVLFVQGAWRLYEVASTEDYVLVPRAISVMFLPAGGALIAFHIGVHAIIDLIYLGVGRTAPEPDGAPH